MTQIPEKLTEDYIAEHTDARLGIVVLRAAQVRALIRNYADAQKLLGDACSVLRTINDARPRTHLAVADVAKSVAVLLKQIEEALDT
jgi:hypothetical protein